MLEIWDTSMPHFGLMDADQTDGIEKKILQFIKNLTKNGLRQYILTFQIINVVKHRPFNAYQSTNFGDYEFWAERWLGEQTVELSKTILRNIVVCAPRTDPVNFLNGLI